MNSIKISLTIVVIISFKLSYAQKPDTVLKSLTRSIERAISRGHEHKECKDLKSAVFSVIITFSSDAKVEDIMFSESPYCSLKTKENIKKHIRNNIDDLKLDKLEFSEKFIMAVVYVIPNKRPEPTLNIIPEEWGSLFKGIDFKRVKGKSMQYSIPIGIYLFQRIEN